MDINTRWASRITNVAMVFAVGGFGYYQWSAAAGPSAAAVAEASERAERWPFRETWTRNVEAYQGQASRLSEESVRVGHAVEGMADALAAGDAAAYREHLRQAEAMDARGGQPTRTREDLVRGAQERYEDKHHEHAAARATTSLAGACVNVE